MIQVSEKSLPSRLLDENVKDVADFFLNCLRRLPEAGPRRSDDQSIVERALRILSAPRDVIVDAVAALLARYGERFFSDALRQEIEGQLRQLGYVALTPESVARGLQKAADEAHSSHERDSILRLATAFHLGFHLPSDLRSWRRGLQALDPAVLAFAFRAAYDTDQSPRQAWRLLYGSDWLPRRLLAGPLRVQSVWLEAVKQSMFAGEIVAALKVRATEAVRRRSPAAVLVGALGAALVLTPVALWVLRPPRPVEPAHVACAVVGDRLPDFMRDKTLVPILPHLNDEPADAMFRATILAAMQNTASTAQAAVDDSAAAPPTTGPVRRFNVVDYPTTTAVPEALLADRRAAAWLYPLARMNLVRADYALVLNVIAVDSARQAVKLAATAYELPADDVPSDATIGVGVATGVLPIAWSGIWDVTISMPIGGGFQTLDLVDVRRALWSQPVGAELLIASEALSARQDATAGDAFSAAIAWLRQDATGADNRARALSLLRTAAARPGVSADALRLLWVLESSTVGLEGRFPELREDRELVEYRALPDDASRATRFQSWITKITADLASGAAT